MASDGEQFVGKFNLVSQENLDEYLKAIGLNAAIRALASTAKPQIELTIDEHTEEWTMHIHNIPSGSHEMVIKFKLDEDTDITWPDGRHIKANFHLDAEGHLVQREHWDDKEVTAVHQIKGDEWIATISCGSVRCTRRYKRV